ncbi:MAG: hypothetical protein INR69_07690 [Mucilaginibacter polytrichastri]|nr:hypothetical protein [Mucilaginibacter polytrichastri]
MKKQLLSGIVILIILSLLTSCDKDENRQPGQVQINDDFSSGRSGWVAGFADYPPDNAAIYELSDSISALPKPLDSTKKGYRISGTNRSDDLFMYIKKPVEGLKPNTQYDVSFKVVLASNAIDNFGIGGSPGTSVGIGGGITLAEPGEKKDDLGHLRMNIDKIMVLTDGRDMIVLGNMDNGTDKEEYASITREGSMSFKTDQSGKAWLIIGTDSGFEGNTTVYYQSVHVQLRPVSNE